MGDAPEGGTFRVFETLAEGLAGRGWAGDFVGEHSLGTEWKTLPDPQIARRLRERLGDYDAVIGNVLIGPRLMNLLRYLPAELPRVMVVHSISYATYRAARALRGHVHHTIAVSPRIRADLLTKLGFDPRRTSTILNAVSDDLFAVPLDRRDDGPLRILSLGRLEERPKRISLIPKIVAGLSGEDYSLTVAGDGPDRALLEDRLRQHRVRADLPGLIPRERLAEIYGRHEVFLFPSRFEGMGLALAEAMAAGLAPLAARIPGVTDALIEDGVSGYLFDQGDLAMARRRLGQLAADPGLRLEMRRAARQRAEALFRSSAMLDAYAGVLETACDRPVRVRELRMDDWSIPAAMGPGLRALLPKGVRQRVADLLFFR